MAPPCPIKEHLKKSLSDVPNSGEAGGERVLWAVFRERRCRALLCRVEHISGEGLEWGMWERGRVEGELSRVGLLLL